MRYFLRTVFGLGIIVLAVTAMSYAVYQLLQIGTCASGNTPYAIARECPPGVERVILAFPVGMLALVVGGFVYAGRGQAPGSDRPANAGSVFGVIWGGLFLGIAFACFWGVWGPDANAGPDGKVGGLIVGFLFVPLGLGGLLPMLSAGRTWSASQEASGMGMGDVIKLARGARKLDMGELAEKIQELQATRATSSGAPPPSAVGDQLSELERLNRLRQEGAIDDAEFEDLKRRALGR